MKKIPGKYLLIGGVGLLLVVAFSSTFYFYSKTREMGKLMSDTELATQKEVATLTTKVGKLMEIPTDETPTIATVSDRDQLSDQAFFANAQNGDKVLIFAGVKKAILYRPETDKIIEVAPVNIGEANQATAPPATAQNLKVTIYNGTFTAGLAKTVADKIVEKYPLVQIGARKDASKKDYAKTLVVDLNGSYKQAATEMAAFLGADVAVLPQGEVKPDGDLLIILGQGSL